MNFLSIDPSVNNIGFALLQTTVDGKVKHLFNSTYYPDRDLSLVTKCDYFCRKVSTILKKFDDWPTEIILEYPQFMAINRGIIAAQQGYTLDLAFICGAIGCQLSIDWSNIILYTPIQWKGTKPKSATEAAFKRLFPNVKADSEHSIDAVMLGHHHVKKMRYIK